MRLLIAVLGVAIFGASATAATLARSSTTPPAPPLAVASATPTEAPPIVATTPAPSLRGGLAAQSRRTDLDGFGVPVPGTSLPADTDLLPNALRDYRAGFHEGIDFPARLGTPVIASKAGVITRIDRDFRDWTAEQRSAAFAEAQVLGYTPEPTLDRVRGRQIWLDHGSGIITRYAHLSNVAPLTWGDQVPAGAWIGNVGSSGLPEGGPHLHFEIRIGDDFLGDGLTGAELARVIGSAFR